MSAPDTDKQNIWTRHINNWEQSPLSQVAYCKETNLSYSAFGYWRTRLKKLTPNVGTDLKRANFTAVKIKQTIKPSPHFLLKINNRHSIEIQAGFNESLLVDLIRVIEGVG